MEYVGGADGAFPIFCHNAYYAEMGTWFVGAFEYLVQGMAAGDCAIEAAD